MADGLVKEQARSTILSVPKLAGKCLWVWGCRKTYMISMICVLGKEAWAAWTLVLGRGLCIFVCHFRPPDLSTSSGPINCIFYIVKGVFLDNIVKFATSNSFNFLIPFLISVASTHCYSDTLLQQFSQLLAQLFTFYWFIYSSSTPQIPFVDTAAMLLQALFLIRYFSYFSHLLSTVWQLPCQRLNVVAMLVLTLALSLSLSLSLAWAPSRDFPIRFMQKPDRRHQSLATFLSAPFQHVLHPSAANN